MSNHLEDLTAEWLEYNGYFVRKSVLVGKRDKGGFEGELDVVGLHPQTRHLIHIECSLDADPWAKRELRFSGKFDRGRRYIMPLFDGLDLDVVPDQIALLQFGGGGRNSIGGGRIVWVRDFIQEILSVLSTRSPDKMAVPSTLPLVRTMQLAAQAVRKSPAQTTLLPPTVSQLQSKSTK
ncbi:hypothetical protein [Sphingomonas sp.]|uniref:hypothetical protein n=1 Tax=Sphingomonas sp. TaxID=28214 RepID=UPI001831189D|nr:hypothetical protein [Sphingomonas sp.]MBA4760657.1 hypothetical protein [Sphingomonas sp.]